MPRDPAGCLRSCMYVLRKTLNITDRLQTQRGAYAITLHDEDLLDLHEFRRLKTRGLRAAEHGDYVTATRLFQEALDLWRDPPLDDFPENGRGHGSAVALLEQRARVQEALFDSRLALGQHRDLIPEMRELTASDSLRERYWEQLILALYRSNNQVGALDAFSQVRKIMNDGYGIDPGPGLQALQQRILAADPTLHHPAPSGAVAVLNRSEITRPGGGTARTASGHVMVETPGPGVPQELPGIISNFTGRSDELWKLTLLLDSVRTARPGTVITSVITGTAGIGKTALAVQWAHQASEHFPDGQFYLDLRGYDPGRPVDPSEALAALLGSLGFPRREMPSDSEARAARYRSLVAKRRMLVVLDNVRDAEQVRPLLPGTPTCMTLMTSRNALTGLVVRDGAHRLDLDMMSLGDAIKLLAALIGERVVTEPEAAEALALRCCRLPLALRVAAELAAANPTAPLAYLVSELTGHQGLDLLDAGNNSRSSLRAMFSWSYQQLTPTAARTFRLVSVHPGPDFDRYVTAALTGTTAKQADQLLGSLARAHMVERSGHSRYWMHDLLRHYGRELANASDGDTGQRRAMSRLVDYYLHATMTAIDTLYLGEPHHPSAHPPSSSVPSLTDMDGARSWLDTERSSLIAVATHAAANDSSGHAARTLASLSCYLQRMDGDSSL
jgi:DNA-binding SARP family transcriptional activator